MRFPKGRSAQEGGGAVIDWKPIETLTEARDNIVLWVSSAREPYAVLGWSFLYSDGRVAIRGNGLRGEWQFSHWSEINPPPPTQGMD